MDATSPLISPHLPSSPLISHRPSDGRHLDSSLLVSSLLVSSLLFSSLLFFTGRAMDAPSAMVATGAFHSSGVGLPSLRPLSSRKAVQIGEQASGWAQKRRGRLEISPAASSSPNPMSHPMTFDPPPVGMMTYSQLEV